MKGLKGICVFLMVLVLVSSLVLISCAPKPVTPPTGPVPTPPKIEIKAVSSWPVDHVGNYGYKEFIKRVNERSKGEIEIKFVGGPEVVIATDQVKALMAGAIDLTIQSPGYFSGIAPEFLILDFSRSDNIRQMLRESGIYPILNRVARQKLDAVYIGTPWIYSPFFIMTTMPVKSLSELKGLKIRSIGPTTDFAIVDLGASPVKISSVETYEALQRKVVDGAIRNTLSFVEFKEYEVMKYILTPPFIDPSNAVLLRGAVWDKLSSAQQNLLLDTMIEVERDALKFYQDVDKKNLDDMLNKYGCKFTPLPAVEVSRLYASRLADAFRAYFTKLSPVDGPELLRLNEPYSKL